MKTNALVDFLKHGNFDFIFGGARRDEEQSRAKERVLSYRNKMKFGSQQIKTLSHGITSTLKIKKMVAIEFSHFRIGQNWIFDNIKNEKIKVVPLYFKKER